MKIGMFFAVALLVGCGPPNFVDVESECPTVQKKQALFGISSLYWKKEKVRVCWDSFDTSSSTDREFVKAMITVVWDVKIDLDFIGWGLCDESPTDVKIVIKDARPASWVGMNYGFVNTVNLNFTFDNFFPKRCQQSELLRLACIASQTTHEFGHVLGFVHEQSRQDTPDDCIDGRGPDGFSIGDTEYGAYDARSIMNYCGPLTGPSCQDINAAQEIYGPETGE